MCLPDGLPGATGGEAGIEVEDSGCGKIEDGAMIVGVGSTPPRVAFTCRPPSPDTIGMIAGTRFGLMTGVGLGIATEDDAVFTADEAAGIEVLPWASVMSGDHPRTVPAVDSCKTTHRCIH
jgi:hypothetical protein